MTASEKIGTMHAIDRMLKSIEALARDHKAKGIVKPDYLQALLDMSAELRKQFDEARATT